MMIALRIAGILIHIKAPNLEFAQRLRALYAPFVEVAPHQQPAATIEIIEEPLEDSDDIKVYHLQDYIRIEGGEFRSVTDKKDWDTKVQLRLEPSVFDCFLRVFYSLLLPHYQGFLLHAAGLACGKDGYLFLGVSESGKTTTARNAQTFDVLNDELTCVREINQKFYLFGTPFRGEYEGQVVSRRVELKRVFFLDQKITDVYVVDDKIEMLQEFMDHIFFFDSALQTNQINLNLTLKMINTFEGVHINILAQKPMERWIHDVEKRLVCS